VTPRTRNALELLACLLIGFTPGAVGGRFQPGEWYAALTKPALTPPGWVFPVAWTLLYATMGVALFLVWQRRGAPLRTSALAVFAVQLVLNAAWSWLFFGLHRPDLAFIDIVALWVLILASAVLFRRIRPVAGALLLPYLAWVGFASYLNLMLWRLNTGP
jgi:benzodiazapine receptor